MKKEGIIYLIRQVKRLTCLYERVALMVEQAVMARLLVQVQSLSFTRGSSSVVRTTRKVSVELL